MYNKHHILGTFGKSKNSRKLIDVLWGELQIFEILNNDVRLGNRAEVCVSFTFA